MKAFKLGNKSRLGPIPILQKPLQPWRVRTGSDSRLWGPGRLRYKTADLSKIESPSHAMMESVLRLAAVDSLIGCCRVTRFWCTAASHQKLSISNSRVSHLSQHLTRLSTSCSLASQHPTSNLNSNKAWCRQAVAIGQTSVMYCKKLK